MTTEIPVKYHGIRSITGNVGEIQPDGNMTGPPSDLSSKRGHYVSFKMLAFSLELAEADSVFPIVKSRLISAVMLQCLLNLIANQVHLESGSLAALVFFGQ